MTVPPSEPAPSEWAGAPSGGPPSGEPTIDQLERDLARLRAELADYQGLIDELPQIYEEKFRGQVQDLVQDIRHLMDERQVLQEQLRHALAPPPAPRSLVPSAPASAPPAISATPPPPPRVPEAFQRVGSWRDLVGRWGEHCRDVHTTLTPLLRDHGRWFVLALVLAAAGSTLALLRFRSAPAPTPLPPRPAEAPRSPAPSPAPPPAARSDQDLRLRATGESWLEVRTLAGEVVYVNTLQDGEDTTIRLRDGLEIRSGRPDLLEFSVDDQPFQVLGPVDDLSWRTVLPLQPVASP
ncbi:MAG: RodZ domain-containing protein [Cyanobacteriota bacterium]|nr:RodZ domain-containing protein [Cyanobacteriota bacterium]